MSKLAYNIIEYIMIIGTFLSIVLLIIACVFYIKNLNILILLLKNEMLLSLSIPLARDIKIVFLK